MMRLLTKTVDSVVEHLNQEMKHVLSAELPLCKEWTALEVLPVSLRIIAILTGRPLVGSDLNRNEQYLSCTIQYAFDAYAASAKLQATHPLLRPFSRWRIPEVKAIEDHLATMKRLIRPLVEQQWKQAEEGKAEFPNNMISWNLKNSPSSQYRNLDYQALQQLLTPFAATYTTAKLLSNIIFDLAAHPEYMKPLRDELQDVLDTDGGVLLKSSMKKLRKMDSFMSEVHRSYPPAIMTFNRATMVPITLSNGLYLPKGTMLAVPVSQIAHDPNIWDAPEKFDGFRFEKLRNVPGQSSKYQVRLDRVRRGISITDARLVLFHRLRYVGLRPWDAIVPWAVVCRV